MDSRSSLSSILATSMSPLTITACGLREAAAMSMSSSMVESAVS